MSGRVLPVLGSLEPWAGGRVTAAAECVLALNPSPMTLDGTNTWLLGAPDSESVVIVDPGPADPEHLAAVAEAALARGRVAWILLTHGHADHSEGARALADAVAAPVRAVDAEHRLGGEGLAGGAVLDMGGWTVDVIATPGHSADSICLVLPHDGSVLTGDTVLGRGSSVVAWPDGRLGPYLDSLRRLRDMVSELDVTRILPGHGPALADPANVIDAYLDHRMQRLAEVEEVLAPGVSEPRSIVEIVYADVPLAVWPFAELSVRAQLEYLEGL